MQYISKNIQFIRQRLLHDFKDLLFIRLFYSAALSSYWAFNMLILKQIGVNSKLVYIRFILTFAFILFYSHLFLNKKVLFYRKSIKVGLFFRLMTIFTMIIYPSIVVWLCNSFLVAISMLLFWMPFNSLYFSLAKILRSKGLFSGLYSFLPSAVGIIMPLLSGYLANIYGLKISFAMAAFIMVLAIILANKIKENFEYFDLEREAKIHRKIRKYWIMEGIYYTSNVILTYITVNDFVNKPLDLGIYLSLITTAAAFTALFLSYLSDKIKGINLLLYVFLFLLSISYIPAIFIKDIESWYFSNVIIKILRTLVHPFIIKLTVDLAFDVKDAYLAREYYLALGRVLGFGIGALFIIFNIPRYILLIYPPIYFIWLYSLRKEKIKEIGDPILALQKKLKKLEF